MSRVRTPRAGPHDALPAHRKEGRTQDGQGGSTPQEPPGRSRVKQGVQAGALSGPWPKPNMRGSWIVEAQRMSKPRERGTDMTPPCPNIECTQDGQGGHGPQESLGRTGRDECPWPLGPASTESGLGTPPFCLTTERTQDGQGGLGPQESLGRTMREEWPQSPAPAPAEKRGLGRPPFCRTTECTQEDQGGLGPQESLGRAKRDERPAPLGLAPANRSGPGRPPPCTALD